MQVLTSHDVLRCNRDLISLQGNANLRYEGGQYVKMRKITSRNGHRLTDEEMDPQPTYCDMDMDWRRCPTALGTVLLLLVPVMIRADGLRVR